MKLIPLTQGQFTKVSDHWFDYLNQWKWYARWANNTQSFYAVRMDGKTPNRRSIWMHRVVAQTPEGMICDHIFRDTLDNQEENLRNVTTVQSVWNRGIHKNNKLGILGVSLRSNYDPPKYLAHLRFEGNLVLNKTCETLKEAIKLRKEAEQKYFGEFSPK